MQNSLLTIQEVIAKARKSGASLGHGDPKVHLAYLTKLRLLPQAVRRKIGNQITGCYPDYVISTLKQIEELKSTGLTYAQIRLQLTSPELAKLSVPSNLSSNYAAAYSQSPTNHSPLAFLLIGLILGFLLATNYPGGSSKVSEAASLPPHTASDSLVKIVSASNPQSEPIYLIAIPNQNLYKLGKTDINLLR